MRRKRTRLSNATIHEVDQEEQMILGESQMSGMDFGPDRIPRGIETEENRIFFYCPIGDREALELNRLIRRLDIEMQYLQNRLDCGEVPIHLHIQSPGGSVFAGLSIYDTIKNCKTPIYTYVEGAVASAATIIACAGEKGKRFVGKSACMLVHQPHLEWVGKLDDFRDEIENQKQIYDKLISIYLENTKFKKKELTELLEHELWLSAEKCIEKGLVDELMNS